MQIARTLRNSELRDVSEGAALAHDVITDASESDSLVRESYDADGSACFDYEERGHR